VSERMERASCMRWGVRSGYVQPCGLIVSAGCDRCPADATFAFASFEGAAGTAVASGQTDPDLSHPADQKGWYRIRRIQCYPTSVISYKLILVLKLLQKNAL
jgi:hypothetical protein